MADNGSGNYGGNGSVWWQVVHGANNQPDKHLKRVDQVSSGQKNEHWVKARANEDRVVGHDPIELSKVGSGNKKGRFEVSLRYTTRPPFSGGGSATMRAVAVQELLGLIQSATAALTTIATTPDTADVEVTVSAYVPAIQRPDPPTDGQWEVTVDW